MKSDFDRFTDRDRESLGSVGKMCLKRYSMQACQHAYCSSSTCMPMVGAPDPEHRVATRRSCLCGPSAAKMGLKYSLVTAAHATGSLGMLLHPLHSEGFVDPGLGEDDADAAGKEGAEALFDNEGGSGVATVAASVVDTGIVPSWASSLKSNHTLTMSSPPDMANRTSR